MRQVRQYIGILAAATAYYLVHEGAHLLCAVLLGTFKQIHIMGLGMQIDVYAERMTDGQMALFCIAGAVATLLAGIVLAALAEKICRTKSRLLRAVMYYITIVLNGSPKRERSDTMRITRAFLDGMNEAEPQEVHTIHVIDKQIEYCTGCFSCMRNGGTCVHDDNMREIYWRFRKAIC